MSSDSLFLFLKGEYVSPEIIYFCINQKRFFHEGIVQDTIIHYIHHLIIQTRLSLRVSDANGSESLDITEDLFPMY